MTDTISSTPQPPRPESGSESSRPQRFRLPEPAAEPADAASQAVRSPRPVPRISTATARGAAAAAEAGSALKAATPPQERYGKKRAGMSMPKKVGLVAVGLLVLGGVAGYIGWQQANPTIQGTVTSFTASGTSVVVTFEVDKPADRNATCGLIAEDVHGTVIGSASVPILAGREKNVESYTLQTTSQANTVIVETCSLTS